MQEMPLLHPSQFALLECTPAQIIIIILGKQKIGDIPEKFFILY